jgi:molybdopterin-guanine dinucleotide biosynthesis protein A
MLMERLGLLLLCGGKGQRLGGPKHLRPHPKGLSWARHLVNTFRELCPKGPVHLLGDQIPDALGLVVKDPRQGPAVAISAWAKIELPETRRWWIVPSDQVLWEPKNLASWLEEAENVDPDGEHWVMALESQREQPLGGFIGSKILPRLANLHETRVRDLVRTVPKIAIHSRAYQGLDVDTPEDLALWQSGYWATKG